MSELTRCWFCRRSDAEVSAFADMETPGEKEIAQQMSQVTKFKADFVQSADAWRKGVPKELKEFDFKFVISNADQFKPIRIGNGLLGEIVAPNKLLGEIGEAKKTTFDWLENAAVVLRKGDGEVSGFGPLSAFDKVDRELLSRMVDQFESKWRRSIGGDGRRAGSSGYKQGFEEMKLFDGLEFMIAAGVLYYEVQTQLLEIARKKEVNSKPKRGVSVQLVSGYPPVPICSVCADVMRAMGSHQLAVEPAAPPQVSARHPARP